MAVTLEKEGEMSPGNAWDRGGLFLKLDDRDRGLYAPSTYYKYVPITTQHPNSCLKKNKRKSAYDTLQK